MQTKKKTTRTHHIVTIGGGTGQATVLKSLNKYKSFNLSGIVAMTDCGRHSGLIRKELNLLPPGDIRNCITALADTTTPFGKLLSHRFANGKTLKGMSVGNIIIAALSEMNGNFESGVNETCKLLNIKPAIIPATLQQVHLCAELKDKTRLKSEIKVRRLNKDRIAKLYLSPKNATTNPKAIKAINKADAIILGPGSLYTSILTNLLLPELKEAIIESKAKKIVITNLLTQPGQTDRLSGEEHLNELITYLGKNVIDYAVINNQKLSSTERSFFKKQGVALLKISLTQIKKMRIIPVFAPLISTKTLHERLWEKHNLLHHDEEQLGELLHKLITQAKGII